MATLSITSIWPALAATLVFLGAAQCLARFSGAYRRELAKQAVHARSQAIDGLRGFLALGVFFMHVVITRFYYQTHVWAEPPSAFYTLVGQVGVSLFFAITAFLFWSKILRGPLDAGRFYTGRFRRLAPMYFVAVAVTLAVVAGRTGWRLQVTPAELGAQVLAWCSFGFMTLPDVNGLRDTMKIDSVLWTLAFEWTFYLLLPMLALFVRGRRFVLLVTVVVSFVAAVRGHSVVLNFVAGAVAAQVVASGRWREALTGSVAAVAALAAMGTLFLFFDRGYGVRQVLLMSIFFLPVAHGNTLFGLLGLLSARWLGLVSYSIYLLHSVVLYLVFAAIDATTPVASLSPEAFWLTAAVCGLGTIGISAVSYRRVEYVFMRQPGQQPGVARRAEGAVSRSLKLRGLKRLTVRPRRPSGRPAASQSQL